MLSESALAVRYAVFAAEKKARAALKRRRVMLSFHEGYTQYQSTIQADVGLALSTVDDLIVAYKALQEGSRLLTAHQQMIVKTIMD